MTKGGNDVIFQSTLTHGQGKKAGEYNCYDEIITVSHLHFVMVTCVFVYMFSILHMI